MIVLILVRKQILLFSDPVLLRQENIIEIERESKKPN